MSVARYAPGDEQYSEPVQDRGAIAEDDYGEQYRQRHAEFVDGRDLGNFAQLNRFEIEQPGRPPATPDRTIIVSALACNECTLDQIPIAEQTATRNSVMIMLRTVVARFESISLMPRLPKIGMSAAQAAKERIKKP